MSEKTYSDFYTKGFLIDPSKIIKAINASIEVLMASRFYSVSLLLSENDNPKYKLISLLLNFMYVNG